MGLASSLPKRLSTNPPPDDPRGGIPRADVRFGWFGRYRHENRNERSFAMAVNTLRRGLNRETRAAGVYPLDTSPLGATLP